MAVYLSVAYLGPNLFKVKFLLKIR